MTLRIDRRDFVAAGLAALAQGSLLGHSPLLAADQLTSAQGKQVLDLRGNGANPKVQNPEKPPVMSSVAVSSGGKLFATAGDDHCVRVWNHEDGKLLQTLSGHQDWVRCVLFVPNGSKLFSAGDDHCIIVWNLATGQPERVHPRHDQVVYSLALSADARRLAAVGFETTVRVYDVPSGQELLHLAGPCNELRAVTFSPDGKYLATAGRNGQIRIWSLSDGQPWLDIAADSLRIRSLAYSPSGDVLASAGDGRSIALWETQGGKLLGRLSSKKAKVMAIRFCGPARLASGGTDNLVRIWDTGQQIEEFQLTGHTGTVTALDYDAPTDVLVSASYDTTVRVWPLRQGDGVTR